MPRGGKRPGAGRKKGAKDQLTAELRALAIALSEPSLREVARLAVDSKDERNRLTAARELRNWGFGRLAPFELPHGSHKIERIYRWASNPAEATTDPARPRLNPSKDRK